MHCYTTSFTNFGPHIFVKLEQMFFISSELNKSIKNTAISLAPDEDCYSTKLYYGYVMSLKNKVDYIFIPRFQSEHPIIRETHI